MTTTVQGATALARRAHVEALLAAYPDVTPDEHGLLVHWFKREASSLDVALIASNPEIAPGYARFRGEHIDRFTLADLAKGLAGLVAIVGIAALIMLRAF